MRRILPSLSWIACLGLTLAARADVFGSAVQASASVNPLNAAGLDACSAGPLDGELRLDAAAGTASLRLWSRAGSPGSAEPVSRVGCTEWDTERRSDAPGPDWLELDAPALQAVVLSTVIDDSHAPFVTVRRRVTLVGPAVIRLGSRGIRVDARLDAYVVEGAGSPDVTCSGRLFEPGRSASLLDHLVRVSFTADHSPESPAPSPRVPGLVALREEP